MLPLQVQTAYQDLLQRFQSAPVVPIEGSILAVEKAGRRYWVARRRIGDAVTEQAIGPDTAETQALVEAAREVQGVQEAWNRENAQIVAMLRATGCLVPDQTTGKLLSALDRVGFFRSGGVLGGTQAFRHYPLHLGVDVPSAAFSMTGDLDLMAPSHIVLTGDDGSLTQRLAKTGLDLRTVFGLSEDSPRKWVVEGGIELELLSPVRRGGKTSHQHPGLGEPVQALRHLEFAFKDPIRGVSLYRSGVGVTLPSPQRYALHKLMVAQLRKGNFAPKRRKDLNQAVWLVEVLAATQPYELWAAWGDLWKRGPKWRGLAEASLAERPEIGERLAEVEAQFGRVREA